MAWTGSIRLSTHEDIPFIISCENSETHKYLHSWTNDVHKKNMGDKNFIYLSGLDENREIAGYSLLKKSNEKTIEYMRVASKVPNIGFGKPFMKAVLNYLIQQTSYEKIWLDVYEANERARHVYRSIGFIETSKVQPPDTIPCNFGRLVVMQKYISS